MNPDPDDMDEEEDDNIFVDAEDDMDEGEYEIMERGGGDAGTFFKFVVNFTKSVLALWYYNLSIKNSSQVLSPLVLPEIDINLLI